jgi:pimeloyl-ACP methyl ester carboxylesterase
MKLYKERKLKTSRGKLAYIECGDPKGEPILFLHGWLDNASSFIGIYPHLLNYHLFGLDFPGHGKSDFLARGEYYHFLEYACDVFNFTHSFSYKKWNVIGHSMGAGVASLAAGAHPSLWNKIVLIEGLGPATREGSLAPAQFYKAWKSESEINFKKESIFPDWDKLVKLRMKSGNLQKYSASEILLRGTKKMKDGWKLTRDPRLVSNSLLRMTEDQVKGFCNQIESPVLFITGDEGLNRSFPGWEERKKYIPNVKHVQLKGGHHLHIDDPMPTVEEIINFLES